MNLEETVELNFKEILKYYGRPRITEVVLTADNTPTASISFEDFKIRINPDFVKELTKKGADLNMLVKGILHHELGHYIYHTWDLKTQLYEIMLIKSNGYKDIIRRFFDDVVNNSYILINSKDSGLDEVWRSLENTEAMSVMKGYYSAISGLDFGIDIDNLEPRLKNKIKMMTRINFFDKSKIKSNLLKFAAIMDDLIRDQEGGLDDVIYDTSQKNILKSLDKLIDELPQKEANDIFDTLKDYLETKGVKSVDLLKYRLFASQHKIRILKRDLEYASDFTYPEKVKEFEFGDPLHRINYYQSLGKIYPPFAKTWTGEGYLSHGQKRSYPDAIVLLDSSGSMVDPSKFYSYSLEAALAVTISYINAGSKVAGGSFSKTTLLSGFTDNLEDLFKFFSFYEGNITLLNIDLLRKRASSTDRKIDITVISDMGLNNFDEFYGFIDELDTKLNRLTVLLATMSSESAYEKNIKRLKDFKNKIGIYKITKREDLDLVVLGGKNELF